jgi:hypothetical protein
MDAKTITYYVSTQQDGMEVSWRNSEWEDFSCSAGHINVLMLNQIDPGDKGENCHEVLAENFFAIPGYWIEMLLCIEDIERQEAGQCSAFKLISDKIRDDFSFLYDYQESVIISHYRQMGDE